MNYAKITSVSNSKIKQALDIKNKRGKYKNTAFIIEGPHLIEMAMTSGSRIKEVFFTSELESKKDSQRLLEKLSKLEQVIPRLDRGIQKQFLKPTGLDSRLRGNDKIEVFEVSEHIINKLADTETPQGIFAIASYAPKKLDEIRFKAVPLIVIADGVQEPGNLGTIIRTADAAGAGAVIILKGTCDVFMQKSLRATAGSIFNIPIIYSDTDNLFQWLKTNGIMLAATALDSGKSVFEADLKKPVAFVFGNEAHGVSNEIKRKADLILKIPILGKAESLNVAASTAVCLYEAVRQRMQL